MSCVINIVMMMINNTKITPFTGIAAWQCGITVKSISFELFNLELALLSSRTMTELLKSYRITQPESDQALIKPRTSSLPTVPCVLCSPEKM